MKALPLPLLAMAVLAACTMEDSPSDLFLQPSLATVATVCTGDQTLSTQAQVDAFACTELNGSLFIKGPDITDLTPLHGLTSISGHLNITDNPGLTEVAGLSELTSVGWNLSVNLNASLDNLHGLSALQSVGWHLDVIGNPALQSMDGLPALTTVGLSLRIGNNGALGNLDGLVGLSSLGGPLIIEGNDGLTNLDGLAGLTSVGVGVQIHSNAALTDVDGLAGLTSVDGFLYLYYNPQLNGCTCGLYSLFAQGGVSGAVEIHDNAPGCNSVEEDILDPSAFALCQGNLPPSEAIEDLIEAVEGLPAETPITNSLGSKLKAAQRSLEEGLDLVAVRQLEAFINQVEAQRGKKLTHEEADALIAAARAIIESIGA